MDDIGRTEQAAKQVEEAWNTLAGSGESVPTGPLWDALWAWMEARRIDRGTPEPDQSFTQSFQAESWARAFVAIVRRHPGIATDEGTMLGWFANAIMRGYNERTWESKKKLLNLAKQIEALPRRPVGVTVHLPEHPNLSKVRALCALVEAEYAKSPHDPEVASVASFADSVLEALGPAKILEIEAGVRERLAAYAHNAWSRWMRYLFSQMDRHDCDTIRDATVIPHRLVERWTRQLNTEFDDLPVHEQMSDLAEADKMLAILRGG